MFFSNLSITPCKKARTGSLLYVVFISLVLVSRVRLVIIIIADIDQYICFNRKEKILEEMR